MHATVPYSSTHHGSLGQVDDPFLFTILQQQFTPKTTSTSNTYTDARTKRIRCRGRVCDEWHLWLLRHTLWAWHEGGGDRTYRVHRTQLPRNEHKQKHSLLCSPAGRRSLSIRAIISTSPDAELDFRHPLSPNWDLHHRSRKRLYTALLQKWLSAAWGYLLLILLCVLKYTLLSPVAEFWFRFDF